MTDLSEMVRTTDLRNRNPQLSAFEDPVSRELAIEFVARYRALNALVSDPRELTTVQKICDLDAFRTLARSAIERGDTDITEDERDLKKALGEPSW